MRKFFDKKMNIINFLNTVSILQLDSLKLDYFCDFFISEVANLYETSLIVFYTWLFFSLSIFLLGFFGLVFQQSNFLIFLIKVEVMHLGLNLLLLWYGFYMVNVAAYIYSLLLLGYIAAESAIGLSLFFRLHSYNLSSFSLSIKHKDRIANSIKFVPLLTFNFNISNVEFVELIEGYYLLFFFILIMLPISFSLLTPFFNFFYSILSFCKSNINKNKQSIFSILTTKRFFIIDCSLLFVFWENNLKGLIFSSLWWTEISEIITNFYTLNSTSFKGSLLSLTFSTHSRTGLNFYVEYFFSFPKGWILFFVLGSSIMGVCATLSYLWIADKTIVYATPDPYAVIRRPGINPTSEILSNSVFNWLFPLNYFFTPRKVTHCQYDVMGSSVQSCFYLPDYMRPSFFDWCRIAGTLKDSIPYTFGYLTYGNLFGLCTITASFCSSYLLKLGVSRLLSYTRSNYKMNSATSLSKELLT